MKKVLVTLTALSILISGASIASAASQSKVNALFKKIMQQALNTGNNQEVGVLNYYDTQIKQAIGKVLDGKVKCDQKSKNTYKAIAYDQTQPEQLQVIEGFYLGYCNAK